MIHLHQALKMPKMVLNILLYFGVYLLCSCNCLKYVNILNLFVTYWAGFDSRASAAGKPQI